MYHVSHVSHVSQNVNAYHVMCVYQQVPVELDGDGVPGVVLPPAASQRPGQ